MKKLIALMLCVLCLFSLAACQNRAPAEGSAEAEGSAGLGMANPFVDYGTLADACAAAGYEMHAPDMIGDAAIDTNQVMNHSMIQIVYADPNAEDGRITLRKAAGVDDISGDYNEYASVRTADADGVTVTLRGEGETVSGAIWTANDASYALQFDTPADEAAVLAIVGAVE